jgi:hypothetical protein
MHEKEPPMTHDLYKLLTFLDEEALLYRLGRAPPDAVAVSLALDGERLEITVSEDGSIQFMRFTGDDNVGDASAAVAKLYRRLRAEIA